MCKMHTFIIDKIFRGGGKIYVNVLCLFIGMQKKMKEENK